MTGFDKLAHVANSGWTKSTHTQIIKTGQSAHIGMQATGPDGVTLTIGVDNPSICTVHEEPFSHRNPTWRHFLITGLSEGETIVRGLVPKTLARVPDAVMTVKVTGKAKTSLIFFPGERMQGKVTLGTIYVLGAKGERMLAAGGPPAGRGGEGGHSYEPTPAGHYILGPRKHVVTPSWPKSVIPWDAKLRFDATAEVEFETEDGKWHTATGPHGLVTAAALGFMRRSGLKANLKAAMEEARSYFVDRKTGFLWQSVWHASDFGQWGWNLLRGGHGTPYFVHTTGTDELSTLRKQTVSLANSHGCIHIAPLERDRLKEFLVEGAHFEVRPYSEVGPP